MQPPGFSELRYGSVKLFCAPAFERIAFYEVVGKFFCSIGFGTALDKTCGKCIGNFFLFFGNEFAATPHGERRKSRKPRRSAGC